MVYIFIQLARLYLWIGFFESNYIKVERLLKKARTAFHKANWRKALSLYDQVLSIDTNNKEALSRLAYIFLKHTRAPILALRYVERLYKLDRRRFDLLCLSGELYFKRGDIYKAKNRVQAYIKKFQRHYFRKVREPNGWPSLKQAEDLLAKIEDAIKRQKEISAKRKKKPEEAKPLQRPACHRNLPAHASQWQAGAQALAGGEEKQTTSVESPSPASVLPVHKDAVSVKVYYGNMPEISNFVQNDLDAYFLYLQYHKLMLLREFDHLLCLETLKDVERLWYQVETIRKVLRYFHGRAILADEVGLGKTIEAGMVIKEYLLRKMIKSVLILVPPTLVEQWKREMAEKFELDFVTTDDQLFQKDPQAFWLQPFIIASINIAKHKHYYDMVTRHSYDLVVVDEVHHLKNRHTLSWKLVNQLKKRFILLLSATPVQNNLVELYNLITLLKPGLFKTEMAFKQAYVKRGNPKIPLNPEKLRALLREVMIRNTRSQVGIHLPPRYATTFYLDPRPGEAEIYHAITTFIQERYDTHPKFNKMTLNLLQMEAESSPFCLQATLAKIWQEDYLEEEDKKILQEILQKIEFLETPSKGEKLLELLSTNKEKVIVFSQFYHTQAYIANMLQAADIPFVWLHGRIQAEEKRAVLQRFQERVNVLITGQIGGEGQNLQFCNTIVNYDLPWNPMKIEQRIGRIHRIGQTREVFIFNFCVKGTIEEQIIRILDEKINLFQLVMGEIDMILGNMDTDRDFTNLIMSLWVTAKTPEERSKVFGALAEEMLKAKKIYEKVKAYDTMLFREDYEV